MPKTTMKELARKLGISRTTVSLVLKGDAEKYRITPATVAKVKTLAAALNFTPNRIATALSTKKTKTIGVIFPNAFESFMGKMIKGIEECLYTSGYSMMLCTSRFDQLVEKRNIEMLTARHVDGILIVFSAPFRGTPHDYSHIHRLIESKIPLVFADRYLPDCAEQTNRVIADDYSGAFEAVKSLASRGCKSVGYISLDIAISSIDKRYEGYCAAIEKFDLTCNADQRMLLKKTTPDSSDLTSALADLQNSGSLPDAFFVTTSGIAKVTSRILEGMNTSAAKPALAWFGSVDELTIDNHIVIEQPHEQIGFESAKMLLDIVDRDEPVGGREIVIPMTLNR